MDKRWDKRWTILAGLLLASHALAGLLVTDVVGKAQLGGVAAPVSALTTLEYGAEVTLAAGARLVAVDLVTGREFGLHGPGVFAVAAKGPQAVKGGKVDERVLPAAVLPTTKLASKHMAQASFVMRSSGRANVPEPVWPVRTVITELPPTLHWKAVDGAERYRLVVRDEAEATLFDETITGPELALPATALQPGTWYEWRVEALAAAGRIADASASFTTASSAVIQRLRAARTAAGANPARRVLYALQLQEAGAHEEARRVWQSLHAQRPDDEQIKRLAQ